MKRLILATSILAATAALAGPYDEPYSIITVDRAPSADPLLRRVIVNRVDDVTVMSDNKAVVPPGSHKVTLDLPPRKGFNLATQYDLALETRPCVRYYVAAKLDSTTTQTWTPVVRSEEPIGECEKKFLVAKAR
jgi:hypothetical protein